jgi:hypothetical protein
VTIDGYWIDNRIYLDHTQLHSIYSAYTLQLTVHYNTCRVFSLCLHWLPVFQHRRIRSPSQLTCRTADSRLTEHSLLNWSLAGRRSSYIARERTTKKTLPQNRPQRKQQSVPLLRSRLGSDHIENMSRGVCLATVANTCHLAYSMHVTLLPP